MSFERRSYSDSAAPTALSSGIGPTGLTINIDDTSGWPTGGVNGPFFVCIGRLTSTPELIEVQSRTGNNMTLASTAKRGINGTSAGSWATGATIEHIHTAQDADEANAHIANTALDHHTQYLNAARHAATTHTQAMLGTGSVGAAQIQADAVGSSELAIDAVDTAAIVNLAVTTAKLNDLAVTAAKIADSTITSGKFAAGSVDAAAIATDAVGALELADNAVAASNIINAVITLAKFAAEDPTDFNPTAASFSSAANLTLGAGGTTYGRYYKIGLAVFGWCGFSQAADGNLPAGSSIRIPVPFTQKSLGTMRGFVAGRARRASDGFISSGTGVIQAGNNYGENIATAGTNAEWDATTPFNWGTPGDGAANLDAVFFMVASS